MRMDTKTKITKVMMKKKRKRKSKTSGQEREFSSYWERRERMMSRAESSSGESKYSLGRGFPTGLSLEQKGRDC